MTYVPTVWKEYSMTAAEKLAALDNLDSMYSQAVTYVDAITHSASYYTKSECVSKYFTSGTDGSGSGLIAFTLDGFSAQEIIDVGSPSGVIAWWSGSEASIPSGWKLCDGTQNYPGPDLRARFVVSAGGTYTKGVTGGSDTAIPTASAVTVGTYAIVAADLPSHYHTYTDYYRNNASGVEVSGPVESADHASSTTAETSDAHGHTGSTLSGEATDIRPKFYAACFIQKM